MNKSNWTLERVDDLTHVIIACAIEVHRQLGPGLLESVYERCLVHELRKMGLRVETQVQISIRYDGEVIDDAFRADVIVEGLVILELKAVKDLPPISAAQTISYLRLSNLPIALLINFHSVRLVDGIKRYANLPDDKRQHPSTRIAPP